MKQIRCDVCGAPLTMETKRKSDIFDYDLCKKHKDAEKHLDMREVYLNALKKGGITCLLLSLC